MTKQTNAQKSKPNMRIKIIAFYYGIFVLVTLLGLLVGFLTANYIEKKTTSQLAKTIPVQDVGWVMFEVDGLRVTLRGAAPSERDHSRLLEEVLKKIRHSRVHDKIIVPLPSAETSQARIEIIQNESMSSIVGLMPREPSPLVIYQAMDRAHPTHEILNLVETIDIPPQDGWANQIAFIAELVRTYPNLKLSAEPNSIRVELVTDSSEKASTTEADIKARIPKDINIDVSVSAPRKFISPFAFEIKKNAQAYEVPTCTLANESALALINEKLGSALVNLENCQSGLGAPIDNWEMAIAAMIENLEKLDTYILRIENNRTHLTIPESIPEDLHKTATSRLRGGLPPGFALDVKIERKLQSLDEIKAAGGKAHIVFTLDETQNLTVSGHVSSAQDITNIESLAIAQFGSDHSSISLELLDGLPSDWLTTSIALFDGLAQLNQGEIILTEETIQITGTVESDEKQQKIKSLAETARKDHTLNLALTVAKIADAPLRTRLEPDACIQSINASIQDFPITFEPALPKIDAQSATNLSRLAQWLFECNTYDFEIAGYTDDVGSEEINLEISEKRAQSVLENLLKTGLEFGQLVAKGYGEINPIAPNDTEEGRKANRRIEIHLLENGAQATPSEGQ